MRVLKLSCTTLMLLECCSLMNFRHGCAHNLLYRHSSRCPIKAKGYSILHIQLHSLPITFQSGTCQPQHMPIRFLPLVRRPFLIIILSSISCQTHIHSNKETGRRRKIKCSKVKIGVWLKWVD